MTENEAMEVHRKWRESGGDRLQFRTSSELTAEERAQLLKALPEMVVALTRLKLEQTPNLNIENFSGLLLSQLTVAVLSPYLALSSLGQ